MVMCPVLLCLLSLSVCYLGTVIFFIIELVKVSESFCAYSIGIAFRSAIIIVAIFLICLYNEEAKERY